MKNEKYYRQLFKKEHDSLIGTGENVQNVMTEDRFISVIKQLSLSGVVSSSNMRKALETVVRGYESDGMENMQVRDNVFYKTCKEALKFDDNSSS